MGDWVWSGDPVGSVMGLTSDPWVVLWARDPHDCYSGMGLVEVDLTKPDLIATLRPDDES